MQREIIKRGKNAVFIQDHQQLKKLYNETQQFEYQINIADVFLQLFYLACQHNRQSTIMFLFQMYYEIFSETERITLRQSFYYGKYKIKKKSLSSWYDKCILQIIKVN